ncbi:MAG: hypothetical protein AAFV53_05695 [Myxococcota bacterium]
MMHSDPIQNAARTRKQNQAFQSMQLMAIAGAVVAPLTDQRNPNLDGDTFGAAFGMCFIGLFLLGSLAARIQSAAWVLLTVGLIAAMGLLTPIGAVGGFGNACVGAILGGTLTLVFTRGPIRAEDQAALCRISDDAELPRKNRPG